MNTLFCKENSNYIWTLIIALRQCIIPSRNTLPQTEGVILSLYMSWDNYVWSDRNIESQTKLRILITYNSRSESGCRVVCAFQLQVVIGAHTLSVLQYPERLLFAVMCGVVCQPWSFYIQVPGCVSKLAKFHLFTKLLCVKLNSNHGHRLLASVNCETLIEKPHYYVRTIPKVICVYKKNSLRKHSTKGHDAFTVSIIKKNM